MFAKKKSLDGILSSFTKVVEDLEVFTSQNEREIDSNSQLIKELREKNEVLVGESQTANQIKTNLKTLMGQ